MQKKEWYGARTVYNVGKTNTKLNLYEERVVVLKAISFSDAILKAEKEAQDYADSDSEVKYLGYVNVFKLFDDKIKNNTEVYSLMRENNLEENEYLDNFFDTGLEKTKHTD